MSYTGYIINGQRFQIKSVEKSTQNSGVSVDAATLCRSSAKDKSQVMDVVAYYGVLQEIILLDYYAYQLPIFKCDWANVGNGVLSTLEEIDENDEITYAREDCESVFIW